MHFCIYGRVEITKKFVNEKEEAMGELYRTDIESPLGTFVLVGDETGLRHLHFPDDHARVTPEAVADPKRFAAAREQLDAYWSGDLREFDLPLAPEGTPFRQKVWDALRGVPYGTTVGYGEIARRIGKPSAARAVGGACGSNPLPVFIPCHRIVGASGALTGFGGGLPTKIKLLELEAQTGK
jgi:methylated-DNA-[protein]-cysteine S-methyltransferase